LSPSNNSRAAEEVLPEDLLSDMNIGKVESPKAEIAVGQPVNG
jgi:hypothetical protein